MRISYIEFLKNSGRRGILHTSQYMKSRHQSKHPERESFKPRPFNTKAQELAYNRWTYGIRQDFEVRGDTLFRKRPDGNSLMLATYETSLFLIAKAHIMMQHAKVNATYKALIRAVYGITREDVQWYVERCPVSRSGKPNKKRTSDATIISSRVLERVQIDLMDFQSEASGSNIWILHVRDHFSGYIMLYPLESKESKRIAECLRIYMGHYGVPEILECDNEKDFEDEVKSLADEERIKMIHNQDFHSQIKASWRKRTMT